MEKKNVKNQVIMDSVANYAQAHNGARSMRAVTGTISQAAKSLGGIGDEVITIGKGDNKEKITITVENFFKSLELPYGNGRVVFQSIKARWADYLTDKEGNFMLCKNVIQRVKIGKQSYVLYRVDEKGNYKAATVYEPAIVRGTSWTPYLICEGLAQSKFIDEVAATVEQSRAAFEVMKNNDELYVHDSLTDNYVLLSTVQK